MATKLLKLLKRILLDFSKCHLKSLDNLADCYHDSYNGAPADGSAWTTTCSRSGGYIIRGGSWFDFPKSLRAAMRGRVTDEYAGVGFRLARTLTP